MCKCVLNYYGTGQVNVFQLCLTITQGPCRQFQASQRSCHAHDTAVKGYGWPGTATTKGVIGNPLHPVFMVRWKSGKRSMENPSSMLWNHCPSYHSVVVLLQLILKVLWTIIIQSAILVYHSFFRGQNRTEPDRVSGVQDIVKRIWLSWLVRVIQNINILQSTSQTFYKTMQYNT